MTIKEKISDTQNLGDILMLKVSLILKEALNGTNRNYRDSLGYIIWDKVESDIHSMIKTHTQP